MFKSRSYTYNNIERLQTVLTIASMAALAALAVFHSNRRIVLAAAALAAILILANLLIDKFVNQKILKQLDGCLKQLATGEVVEISAKQIKRHQMFKRIGGVARHYA